MTTVLIKKPDRVTAYAERVLAGDVISGLPHIQACRRHIDDLSRQGRDDFPYRWDPEKSEEILEYAETLTIIEGFEPRPVKLYGCQDFDLGAPMGWLNREGYRRFRRKYKSIARQNGKTFENGITGSYIAGFGGYRMGKLFTVATSKKQARLAWEEMAKFIVADPDLQSYFYIKDYKSLIEAVNTGCTIEALSKEGGLQEGFRSIFASVDEIHQHRDGSIVSAIQKGQRFTLEALMSMITTRGTNLASFCFDMDSLCLAVLDGGVVMDDLFADIFTLDDTDDIFDEAVFLKSNPVMCATEFGMNQMRNDAATAKVMGGSELSEYIVKCHNRWLENSDLNFATPSMLRKSRVSVGLEAMRGQAVYVGLDLSHGGDLTTLALEFEPLPGCFYVWSLSYMPRGRLLEHIASDIAPYDLWEQRGLLHVTGGLSDFKNDYSFIISDLERLCREFDLKLQGIGYDPHNADGFLASLERFGCPLLEITQSARFLSAATEEIQLLMKGGYYCYDQKNELLDWSFRNAVIVFNSFKERKIDKNPDCRTGRIDPCDAAIDAHVTRMKLSETNVDLNKSLQEYLKKMGWDGKEKNEKEKA